MRITAKKALGQKIRVQDPLAGGPGRASKLAEIEANALEFVEELLLDLDIPSVPRITLGKLRGFEDVHKDFEDTSGVITVFANFSTQAGHKLRVELPIPIYKGHFQRPSIAKISGKKYVFSQALLDKLIDKYEFTRPKLMNPMTPSPRFIHEQNTERELFDPPRSNTNWFDLIKDVY